MAEEPEGVELTELTAEEPEPTMSLSLARKINTGNYESAEAFVSIQGVRAGMTVDDLEPLLSTGRIAYDAIREELRQQIAITIDEAEAAKAVNRAGR